MVAEIFQLSYNIQQFFFSSAEGKQIHTFMAQWWKMTMSGDLKKGKLMVFIAVRWVTHELHDSDEYHEHFAILI